MEDFSAGIGRYCDAFDLMLLTVAAILIIISLIFFAMSFRFRSTAFKVGYAFVCFLMLLLSILFLQHEVQLYSGAIFLFIAIGLGMYRIIAKAK